MNNTAYRALREILEQFNKSVNLNISIITFYLLDLQEKRGQVFYYHMQ